LPEKQQETRADFCQVSPELGKLVQSFLNGKGKLTTDDFHPPPPFALSLSKGIPCQSKGFDKLSPNG
jgi:hypothetical protein